MTATDPTGTTVPVGDFAAVLGFLAAADPEGALAPCGLRRVVLGADVLGRVADEVAALLDLTPGRGAAPAAVTLLVDDTPILREGVDVKAEVARLLQARFRVTVEVLTDPHPPLHVDEQSLATATRAAQGADAVVSVGGGTVTDIGKVASAGAGGLPHVVVQTAASVDGFTDDVSVVLRSGVKRTVASRWPDVVLADTTTIREAPAVMNKAGLGELTSMFTAPADWRLARLLDLDPSYKEASTRLLATVGEDLSQWSSGLATADLDAVQRLTWALMVRGGRDGRVRFDGGLVRHGAPRQPHARPAPRGRRTADRAPRRAGGGRCCRRRDRVGGAERTLGHRHAHAALPRPGHGPRPCRARVRARGAGRRRGVLARLLRQADPLGRPAARHHRRAPGLGGPRARPPATGAPGCRDPGGPHRGWCARPPVRAGPGGVAGPRPLGGAELRADARQDHGRRPAHLPRLVGAR